VSNLAGGFICFIWKGARGVFDVIGASIFNEAKRNGRCELFIFRQFKQSAGEKDGVFIRAICSTVTLVVKRWGCFSCEGSV
jgi:hypothetical protein